MLCARHNCVPILQASATVSMLYGPEAASDLTSKVLRDFEARGIPVSYIEFGNELYGLWAPPATQTFNAVEYTGATYGTNFTAFRRLLRRAHPTMALSFGVLMSEGAGMGLQWNDDVGTRVARQPHQARRAACYMHNMCMYMLCM